MSKMRFPKRKLHFSFCLFMLLQEKQKKKKKQNGKKTKNPYKNRVFKGGHPKMRRMKKMEV